MTIYELIKELTKYDANKKVILHCNLEFYVDANTECNYTLAKYSDTIDIENINEDCQGVHISFTN